MIETQQGILDESISTWEAARLLGKSYQHIMHRIWDGSLTAAKDDTGRWRVSKASVLGILKEQSEAAASLLARAQQHDDAA